MEILLKKICYDFSEVCVNRKEALRYAGVRNDSALECEELLEKALAELSCEVKPKAVYTELNVECFDDKVKLGEDTVKSKSLAKFLCGHSKAAVFAATAGIEADRLISRYSMVSPSLALMIDAAAAATVEAACNKMCKEVFGVEECRRFSPGYGDFPIEYQEKIIALLNTNLNIGVSITSSLMLAPSKSVTAVVPL